MTGVTGQKEEKKEKEEEGKRGEEGGEGTGQPEIEGSTRGPKKVSCEIQSS